MCASSGMEEAVERLTLESVQVPAGDGAEAFRMVEAEPPAGESCQGGPNDMVTVDLEVEGDRTGFDERRTGAGNAAPGTVNTAHGHAAGLTTCWPPEAFLLQVT